MALLAYEDITFGLWNDIAISCPLKSLLLVLYMSTDMLPKQKLLHIYTHRVYRDKPAIIIYKKGFWMFKLCYLFFVKFTATTILPSKFPAYIYLTNIVPLIYNSDVLDDTSRRIHVTQYWNSVYFWHTSLAWRSVFVFLTIYGIYVLWIISKTIKRVR